MKQERLRSNHSGMSTLEILLAFAVLTLTLSAVILLEFDNSIAATQATLYSQAETIAQSSLSQASADAKADFGLLQPATTTITSGSILYTVVLTVRESEFFVKQATSTVSWTQNNQKHSVSLSMLVADIDGASSNNTCSSMLSGDWSNPQLSLAIQLGTSTAGNPVTGIVAVNKKVYVSTSNTGGHTDDLYIFDNTNPSNPIFLKSYDANTVTAGNNAVAISNSKDGVFAFLANGNASNWNSCTQGVKCAQLQVVDVSNPSNPMVASNFKLSTSTAPKVIGSGGQSVGNTVTYSRGYVYLGLTKTGGGPEFIIIDVGGGGAPSSPRNPKYVGGFSVGRGISSIAVSNGYAYLATSDNTRELIALDIRIPSAPTLAGIFDAPGSNGFGGGYITKVAGPKVYLGRNYVSNAPELYVLDKLAPSAITSLASLDIGTSTSTESVNGLFVRGTMLFLVTSHYVQLWNIADYAHMTLSKTISLTNIGVVGGALGCEGNTLYVGGYKSATDQGVLFTLSPAL